MQKYIIKTTKKNYKGIRKITIEMFEKIEKRRKEKMEGIVT